MFGFLCLLAGVESSTKLAALCRTHNGFSFGCITNDTWNVLVRLEPACLTRLTDHMSLQLPEVEAVRAIVLAAARDAGLNQFRLRDRSVKEDGTVVTQTDHRVQAFIARELQANWPQFTFMGEEMEHRQQARIVGGDGACFWALDPLDGTTNFSMSLPFYGISLGLVVDGTVQLGVVYDPVRDELFSAASGQGAFLNGEKLTTPDTDIPIRRCIANVDYKRLVSQLVDQLVRYPPFGAQRNLGSCVLEWCWLAAGRIQLYLHGGQRMWDYAAGSLILAEAGGAFTTIRGMPLDCRTFTKRSVVAAINPELQQQWLAWIVENDERLHE